MSHVSMHCKQSRPTGLHVSIPEAARGEIKMADDSSGSSLNTGGKESTAYRLMHDIMVAEDHSIYSFAEGQGLKRATRDYMLSLYGECLKATSGQAAASAAKPAAAKPAAKKTTK